MTHRRELVGRWIHAFEEDTEHGAVYRREQKDVPLSRRPRERLILEEDGTAKMLQGGPDDRLAEHSASWSEEEDQVVVRVGEKGSKTRREYRIVERSPDRLVIRS